MKINMVSPYGINTFKCEGGRDLQTQMMAATFQYSPKKLIWLKLASSLYIYNGVCNRIYALLSSIYIEYRTYQFTYYSVID